MFTTLALLVFACLALCATIAWLWVPYRYPSFDEVLDEMMDREGDGIPREKNVANHRFDGECQHCISV